VQAAKVASFAAGSKANVRKSAAGDFCPMNNRSVARAKVDDINVGLTLINKINPTAVHQIFIREPCLNCSSLERC
jgi:hypothetical protein